MNALILSLLAASPISKVVVYPDRAQVTRVAQASCGQRVPVVFEGIPPAADGASFRARTSVGTVDGLRSEERSRDDVYGPKVVEADNAIRKLNAEISVQEDLRTRLNEDRQVANGYAEVSTTRIVQEMAESTANAKAWNGAVDTVLATRLKSASTEIQLNAKIRDLRYQLADWQRKRGRLAAAAQRREYLAEVLVSCPSGQQAEVSLTYLVGGASWSPVYEARADEANGAVDLSAYATVRQSTGESWDQAHLVLSTAIPAQNATPPELQPLQLWAEERAPEKKVLVRREEYNEHAETSSNLPANGPAQAGGLKPVEQGLSVQLQVPKAIDVPGDGSPVRVFVATERLRAKFAFRTAPKQMPFVFRVADVTNTAPFPLLAGPLEAFRRTGLVANYALERVAQGAPFHLTFGIEEQIKVKRTVVEELQRDTGLFGGNKRFRYGYRFELANYGRRPETVELDEQVPVSELDDVKVEVDPKTTGGYQLAADDGIVKWQPTLKPGDKQTVELAYHVDVPSSYDSGGL